jgi:hypothetical protein
VREAVKTRSVVVRVAWVVAGREWGLGRRVDGGMEMVSEAAAKWQSHAARKKRMAEEYVVDAGV